jgi:ABC-2 type transport system permease protein
VQFYFIAPLRIRDAMLAKNLLTFAIFAVEIALIYAVSSFIARPVPAGLAAATVAWSLFTLLLNTSIGNVRSVVSPKALDPARMRSQNVGGMSSLISLAVVAVAVFAGASTLVLCRYLHASLWIAAAVFLALAGAALAAYLLVLGRIDSIAAGCREDLMRELTKA